MSNHADRLAALRGELGRARLDGFVVPLTDEHGSEYVGAYAQRLAWLTGFDGSAGAAVVLADVAAVFVDGRYTAQATGQVDAALFEVVPTLETPLVEWLGGRARAGMRVGADAWLFPERAWRALADALAARGAELVAVDANPMDAVWADRPGSSEAPLVVHGDDVAGVGSAAKRAEIGAWLEKTGADAVALTALDSVAWTMNVRGADVARTPVPLAFALVRRDGTATLFADEAKVGPDVRRHLGNAVAVEPRWAFPAALRAAGGVVAADPERAAHAVFEALRDGGARVVEARDPVVLPKAIKNAVEVAGARAAHARDGAALARFLHWLDGAAPGVDELGAVARLAELRAEAGAVDLSFDTIAGSGPNGAIIHYRVTPQSNRRLGAGELFLIDSGGQYPDGTTDVTRTVAVGCPTDEMRDRYTRVLRGHIAVATAVFPDGAKGCQLDGMARRPLWEAGLDYAHGTGHGVGSYLSVHEGPQRIATYAGGDEPLRAGMILSNEPGYYEAGAYGIRLENLVLIEARAVAGAERPMLGFEALTLAPFDRRLVVADMLGADERAWLDGYHARVADVLVPLVPAEVAAWLEAATAPM